MGLSFSEYRLAEVLARRSVPVKALIAAAMKLSSGEEFIKLKASFPEVYEYCTARDGCMGGFLPTDTACELSYSDLLEEAQHICRHYLSE